MNLGPLPEMISERPEEDDQESSRINSSELKDKEEGNLSSKTRSV